MVTIDQFKKMEVRIATIKGVEDHPRADKLYVLRIDVGGKEKEIVAGIRQDYTKEDLLGKQIVVINNLEPAVVRGVESQAMLLAAQDDKGVSLLASDRLVKPGSPIL